MVTAINNISGNCLSFNGGIHMDPLVKGLREKGNFVIPLDFTLGEMGVDKAVMEKLKTNDKASYNFLMEREAATRSYHSIDLPISPQLSPEQATCYAWLAALDYMGRPGGSLKPEIKKIVEDEILRVAKDVPGVGGLQKK
jgi:hypothetical protein